MENNDPQNFWTRRRWLSRLAFSFLIVAVFLAWTAWHGAQTHELSQGRIILFGVGAMLAFVLFLLGTRERHRPRGDGEE